MAGDRPNSPAGVQETPGNIFSGVAERSGDNVEFLWSLITKEPLSVECSTAFTGVLLWVSKNVVRLLFLEMEHNPDAHVR